MAFKRMIAPSPNAAPGVESALAGRRSLNANRRTAPRQDLSKASPEGTLVGRGGNVQQLGAAAMRRMPPPTTSSISSPNAPPATSSISAPPAGNNFMDVSPGRSVDIQSIMSGQGKSSMPTTSSISNAPSDAELAGAMPPDVQSISRMGGAPPMPGGGPGGPGGGAPTAGIAPGAGLAGRVAGAMPGGAIGTPPQPGAGAGGQFNPNLPPELMSRLQALGGRNPMAGPGGATPPTGGPLPPQGGLDQYFRNMQRGGGGQVYY